MDRRTFSISLAAGVAGSLLATERASAATGGNIVLVHGLYADGSSWSECIVRLQSAGMNVTAVQNPLTSFADDVAATRRALAMQDGPTVLAAHSYGGMVATKRAPLRTLGPSSTWPPARRTRAKITRRSRKDFRLLRQVPGVVTSDGFARLSEDAFLSDFANGVEPVKAHELYAVQASNAAALSSTARTTVAAWRTKPSWYAVSKLDRTINPDLERFMAARMKATTIEVNAGHLSLVSHAPEVTALILQAAAS